MTGPGKKKLGNHKRCPAIIIIPKTILLHTAAFHEQLKAISVNVDDFDIFIVAKVFPQFGHENIHRTCCEVVVLAPNFGEGF